MKASHQNFARQVVVHKGNVTAAARACKMPDPRKAGWRLMQREDVQAEIARLTAEGAKTEEDVAVKVVAGVVDMATMDLTKFKNPPIGLYLVKLKASELFMKHRGMFAPIKFEETTKEESAIADLSREELMSQRAKIVAQRDALAKAAALPALAAAKSNGTGKR